MEPHQETIPASGQDNPEGGNSYLAALDRFGSALTASRYPSAFRPDNRRDRKEASCIKKSLRCVPSGSHVLDLPCGAGRLTSLLLKEGFRVTAADSSSEMVSRARESIRYFDKEITPRIDFDVTDIMQTNYRSGQFDAVICNRLFHHFSETETRKAAMSELRRISSGPVIISFFNSFSLSATARRIKFLLKRKTRTDRIPISMRQIYSELRDSGFRVRGNHAVRWGRSPHWYVIATPDDPARSD